jgi:ribonuclease-3
MSEEPEVLEKKLGYSFRNRDLLLRALTHRSHAFEKAAPGETGAEDNEQLEFLGDAILGFLVSEALVARYRGLPEGRLSKLKAHLVSATHLHEVAQRLEVGRHLLLGKGEELSGGRDKKALLGDALEALIAAIFLDGSMDAARGFVMEHVIADFSGLPGGDQPPLTDFKSALQEAAQARGMPQPRYTIVKQRGPEHAKLFTVEVRVGADWIGRAEDFSKKGAGQKAARVLFEKMMGGEQAEVETSLDPAG